MKATDAVVLENWFPQTTDLEMRGGYDTHMMNFQGIVKTLAVHHGLDGTDQMIAFSEYGAFEATFGGQWGGTTMGARTNGKHITEMFGDGTNNWLIAVNGVDKPWYWNGTSAPVLVDGVTTPAITGLTTTDIVSVAVFKERLLFIRNNKLGFDYLPAGDAGGAATYFDLASIASRGGYLMAIAVWSRDAGDGPDDFAVFLTSQGEAIVYQGTDPSSANTWALVGTFRIGKPLGRRCVLKYGADPLILTEEGLFPLSALLASGDARDQYAVSFKIQSAFASAARESGSQFGWKALSFPERNALIVNIPYAEDGRHEQYVMNTIAKTWCKFTGWHAEDFCVFEGTLYFARGSRIHRAWYGTADDDQAIPYYAQQAYMDFGYPAIKTPLMFMPILNSNRAVTYEQGIDTDFVSRDPAVATISSQSGIFQWDVSYWDQARWAANDSNMVKSWGGTASWPGRWLSGKLRVVSDEVHATWIGSVLRFEVGDGL
jgi:hypothetical protein